MRVELFCFPKITENIVLEQLPIFSNVIYIRLRKLTFELEKGPPEESS